MVSVATGHDSGIVKTLGEVVFRTIRVRGDNVVTLPVKVVEAGTILIVCEPRSIKVGKRTIGIRKGSVLVRDTRYDKDGVSYFRIFPDVYRALRSLGTHVPDTYAREDVVLTLSETGLKRALRLTWIIRKTSPEAMKAEYREIVASVAKQHERVIDGHKRAGRGKLLRGRSTVDARGQENAPSRSPIVWSAERCFGKRKEATRRIQPKIGRRYWALVAYVEKVWRIIHGWEDALVHEMAAFDSPRGISIKRAGSMEVTLETLADEIGRVVLAPFSARALPHIAKELAEAAKLVSACDWEAAYAVLVRARHGFMMTDARRELEECLEVVSAVKKAKATLSPEEIKGLETTLKRIQFLLIAEGRPLDAGFVRPVIAKAVAPQLVLALDALLDPAGPRIGDLYAALKAAPHPL